MGRRIARVVGAGLVAGPLLVTAAVVGAATHVFLASRGRIHTVSDVPKREVGMVLGARAYPDRPSPMLADRLDLAIELHRRGRVERLLMTGDGLARSHNEPEVMRRYVVERGVPLEDVLEDPGGFDTYDSCIRARDAFGLDGFTVISQDFHVPRALTICRWLGIDAVAVGDEQLRHRSPGKWWSMVRRELGANLKMEFDTWTNRRPPYGW